jgi:FkbM family methyltransferase
LKEKINKVLQKFGAEVHGIGYIAKLKAAAVEKNEYQKMKELLNGKASTIFDVGANRGQTTEAFLTIFPKATIHAFEPFEASTNIFKKNHSTKNNVILNETGLSNQVGTATLHINSSVDTNSLLESKKIGATSDKSCETVGTVTIQLNTIDQYCIENNINQIDVLKIDVQGAEIKVLEGAKNMLSEGKIKLIFTESYFVQQYQDQPLFHEIAAFLYQYNFTLQDIYDPYYNTTNILWCDAMYILNQKS